ncbi:hypothetical protein GCM10027589_25850 [Actinocorallia lasiicapitis]
MPFTVSHVAAVLPLRRGVLLPSALAVGAMAPDVPLFAPVSSRSESHGLVGLFTVTLLFSVVLFVLFHGLFKRPLLALAPLGLRERLTVPAGAFRLRSPWDVLWVLVALLVGEATHVAWDAFTHRTGPVVQRLPFLAEQVGVFPIYRYLQYGSGVFGLVVLAVWGVRWLRRAEPVADPAPAASRALRVVTAVVTVVAALAGAAHGIWVRGDAGQLQHGVVGVMVGAFAALFCYAVAAGGLFRRPS